MTKVSEPPGLPARTAIHTLCPAARDACAKDRFPAEDPPRMAATLRQCRKPCIAFKLMAANRNCKTPADTRAAFQFAFDHIKPADLVDVGMFPKYRDQVAENAQMVREILAAKVMAK